MAHSQKNLRDHARRRNQPHIDNQVIAQQLEDLVKPCVYNQLAYYRSLGMRDRILSLPLMVAAVLTLLWRQVPSVGELNRRSARRLSLVSLFNQRPRPVGFTSLRRGGFVCPSLAD